MTGRRIVEMVHEDLRPSAILTTAGLRERHPRQWRDRRLDQRGACICWRSPAASAPSSTLDDWDRFGRDVPTIVDLMPSGRFLMEDFCYAGGLPAVMKAIAEHALISTR